METDSSGTDGGSSNGTDGETATQREWFRFGVLLTLLWGVFTLTVVALLLVDTVLALVFAVVVGTGGGIALTLYVLYWRR